MANIEEGARGVDVEEVIEAAGGDGRAQRRRGGQASLRGARSVGDGREDEVEVLQVAVDPGDQVVEEIRDEVEGEVQVVIEEIGADDLAIREVIYIEEEDDVADDAPMVAQVEQEGEDEEAVGVANEGTYEEIIFEDAVGQVGVEQIDEEGHLEEQADLAEVDPQDGPALSDTIDLTDSPRPNRCAKMQCCPIQMLEYQSAVRRCRFAGKPSHT